MEQHEWSPKSSSEMAPRHHHFNVRVIDCLLDPFRRLHLLVHLLGCPGVPMLEQRFPLLSQRGGQQYARWAGDAQQHSSRQRQYRTAHRVLASYPHIIRKHVS